MPLLRPRHRRSPVRAGRRRQLGPGGLIRLVPVLVTMLVATACAGIPGVYVVERPGDTGGAPQAFDATTYVDGIWETKVVPTVQSDAVPATTLLPALAADQKKASTTYGKQSGSGAPYAFLIKGTGTVTEVNDNGAVGSIAVKVPGVKIDVSLAIGPAFVGTAIRDAVGIGFGEFTNQLDYADAATALNARVKTSVVNAVDPKTIKGHRVTFAGAFSVLDPESVLVTPVELTVAP